MGDPVCPLAMCPLPPNIASFSTRSINIFPALRTKLCCAQPHTTNHVPTPPQNFSTATPLARTTTESWQCCRNWTHYLIPGSSQEVGGHPNLKWVLFWTHIQVFTSQVHLQRTTHLSNGTSRHMASAMSHIQSHITTHRVIWGSRGRGAAPTH